LLRLNDHDIATTHNFFGETITLTDYFAHFIPRQPMGNHSNGTTSLHILPSQPCSSPNCSLELAIFEIEMSWPQVLNIVSDLRGDSTLQPKCAQFHNTFQIPDKDESFVTYNLIGRVLYENEHFWSQLQFQGHTYTYNDMKKDGNLIPMMDPHLLEHQDLRSFYYVYHRTSVKSTVCKFSI
jgi:hypothetical protein